jgi:glycine/D-amino acid oxidase-like deaminating enzyme
MILERRGFIAAGSAALLSGCATIGSRREACSALPPVNVDASRIIRTVAGLRPYRSAGFVVRREPLGDKALVHNYGHGGAGITLSWGSSRLATNLGLQGHSGPVAVIGSGVMGLTTARLVQEAGFPVTLYTAALPPETTSNVAGGQISPFGHFSEDAVIPEWRAQFAAAMAYSWSRFQIMAGERYGIRWLPTYEESHRTEPTESESFMPDWRVLSQADHPFPVDPVVRYRTMYVETPRFLRQLTADVLTAGGKIRLRRFASPGELATLPEQLIFNCTGIGARDLFGDMELHPVRGQLAVLAPQPEVLYAAAGSWGYMFPRLDGILLGGTFERDVWDTTPDPSAIARILASHKGFFGGLRCTA